MKQLGVLYRTAASRMRGIAVSFIPVFSYSHGSWRKADDQQLLSRGREVGGVKDFISAPKAEAAPAGFAYQKRASIGSDQECPRWWASLLSPWLQGASLLHP